MNYYWRALQLNSYSWIWSTKFVVFLYILINTSIKCFIYVFFQVDDLGRVFLLVLTV